MKITIKTEETKYSLGYYDLSDEMVCDKDAFIPKGEYNPHNVRPWIISAEFGPVAIVFASNEQEAFDVAVDNHKLDSYLVECNGPDCEHLMAGNASECFDQTYLRIKELRNPAYSFIALLRMEYGEAE